MEHAKKLAYPYVARFIATKYKYLFNGNQGANNVLNVIIRFVGGELNACYNTVDRHVLAGKGNKIALIHNSPVTKTIRKVTYNELHETVRTFC